MGGRRQHCGPGNAGAVTCLETTLEKRLISAGSAPQPQRSRCESSSTTLRDTAGSEPGCRGTRSGATGAQTCPPEHS